MWRWLADRVVPPTAVRIPSGWMAPEWLMVAEEADRWAEVVEFT